MGNERRHPPLLLGEVGRVQMSYGPGYVLWKQILKEREQRRNARIEARRERPALEMVKEPAPPPPPPAPPKPRRRAGGRTAAAAGAASRPSR